MALLTTFCVAAKVKKNSYEYLFYRKTLEGDFKKLVLTWGTAESEAKDRNLWRKRNGCIILNG